MSVTSSSSIARSRSSFATSGASESPGRPTLRPASHVGVGGLGSRRYPCSRHAQILVGSPRAALNRRSFSSPLTPTLTNAAVFTNALMGRKSFLDRRLPRIPSTQSPPCRARRRKQQTVAQAASTLAPPTLIASEGVPFSPATPPPAVRFGPKDFAVLSLCFVACAISAAFSVVVMAAVPALLALRRAALAIEQLAMTAREELPGTMAAVRLSGMEISDLTMELSDLSQEITEGVRTSARAVKAAEDGIKRMKSYAQTKTVAALEERASLPVEASRPPPYIAKVARQSKEVLSGARSVVSQASMLGSVWRYVPFVGNQGDTPKRTQGKGGQVRGQFS